MGTVSIFTLSIWIVCLSFVSLLTFSLLLFEVTPKIRWLFWFVFYFSMTCLSYILFVLFFPELFISPSGKLFFGTNLCAWISLFFIIASAYFAGEWLNVKKKARRVINRAITIVCLVGLFITVVASVDIRFKGSVDEKEIIVEEPCTIDSIK